MTILLGNAVTEHEVKELRLLRAEKAISSEAEEKLKYLLGVAKNPEDFLLWKLLCHLRLEFIRCFKERKSLQHPNVPSQSQNYEQITELNAVMISSASQIVDIITQILPKMNEIKELLESEKEEVRRLRAISEAVIKNIVADEHQLSGLSIKNMEEREMKGIKAKMQSLFVIDKFLQLIESAVNHHIIANLKRAKLYGEQAKDPSKYSPQRSEKMMDVAGNEFIEMGKCLDTARDKLKSLATLLEGAIELIDSFKNYLNVFGKESAEVGKYESAIDRRYRMS